VGWPLATHAGRSQAAGVGLELGAFGNGIVLGGGNDSRVERNRVVDHVNHGILVTSNLRASA
jgi:hypothetical protein